MISIKDILKRSEETENTILISSIQKNVSFSAIFRNYLVSQGYEKLNNNEIKGDLCYDSYYKDFLDDVGNIGFTVFCYCYDLREIVEDHEKYQFVFESQMESGRGIIGIETIQWVSKDLEEAIINVKYFENKNWEIYKIMGSFPLPKIE